jgi:hypothetical protein
VSGQARWLEELGLRSREGWASRYQQWRFDPVGRIHHQLVPEGELLLLCPGCQVRSVVTCSRCPATTTFTTARETWRFASPVCLTSLASERYVGSVECPECAGRPLEPGELIERPCFCGAFEPVSPLLEQPAGICIDHWDASNHGFF